MQNRDDEDDDDEDDDDNDNCKGNHNKYDHKKGYHIKEYINELLGVYYGLFMSMLLSANFMRLSGLPYAAFLLDLYDLPRRCPRAGPREGAVL